MARTVLVWVAVWLPAAAWAQVPPDLDAYEKRFVGRTIRADHGPGYVWTVLPNQWVDVEGHGISRYNYFFLSDRNAIVVRWAKSGFSSWGSGFSCNARFWCSS